MDGRTDRTDGLMADRQIDNQTDKDRQTDS